MTDHPIERERAGHGKKRKKSARPFVLLYWSSSPQQMAKEVDGICAIQNAGGTRAGF